MAAKKPNRQRREKYTNTDLLLLRIRENKDHKRLCICAFFIQWTKKKHDKTVPTLEVVEVARVKCNLVVNQYQQKYDIWYTIAHNQ